MEASGRGHAAAAVLLLAHPDIDVNARGMVRVFNSRKTSAHPSIGARAPSNSLARSTHVQNLKTALILAAESGRLDPVRALLGHPEVDVNAMDRVSICMLDGD